jgi:signal transduction histidine kinase
VRLRLRLLFGLLVVAPLAALSVLGLLVARGEEARAAAEVRALLERKVEDLAVMLDAVAAELETDLLAATGQLPRGTEALRALGRHHPRLGRLLLVTRGELRFPPADGSEDERRLVRDTRFLWEPGGALGRPDDGSPVTHGWQPLPDGDGVGLLFWRRAGDELVAVWLPGAAVQAQLVARLPVTVPDRAAGDERMALFDPSGRLVYQWGAYVPPPGSKPLVAQWLRPPFGAWRIAYLGPAPVRGRATLGIAGGMVALAAVVVGAGVWLYRESTRELRQAALRVSFVNQVSHELKTPLTNVRMYAELLEDQIDDPVGRRRLGIVVAESQRLDRLISNILTLSRAENGTLNLQPGPGCVDDIVRGLIDQFAPVFEACGVAPRLVPEAPGRVRIDADALTQILGNLLGNVEKYAPHGAVVVRTRSAPPLTRITVEDEGPGIPTAEHQRVFQPFVRLGTAHHEGVPGTGIGLGIARDLARKHGGDLRLVPTARGALFEVILRTEEVA